MTAFGKAANCFTGFVSLIFPRPWDELAALLMTSNPLHKKCPTRYFWHCSFFPLRNSVLRKINKCEVRNSELLHVICNFYVFPFLKLQ